MPWYNPLTWNPGDTITATKLNQMIRDNLAFLLSGKQIAQKFYRTGGANYTVNSTTFVDVNTANLSVGVASAFASGRLRVKFAFWASLNFSGGAAPYRAYFDVDIGGVKLSGGNTYGVNMAAVGAGAEVPISTVGIAFPVVVEGVFTGLSTGAAKTATLQARVDQAATTVTIYSNVQAPVFCFIEEV